MPPKTNTSSAKKGTVLDKVVTTIRALKDTSGKGSSRTAITKYIKSEFDYDNATALKKALKQGVDNGILEQNGQSFRVVGDPVYESTSNKEDELQIEIVREGTGDQAKIGDAVTVKYVGKLDNFENGYEFDKASSFTFVLGAGEVIKGWDKGVEGMKIGGKRKLIVPSKLGYGKRGCKPDIPPNATLYFKVSLKSIRSIDE